MYSIRRIRGDVEFQQSRSQSWPQIPLKADVSICGGEIWVEVEGLRVGVESLGFGRVLQTFGPVSGVRLSNTSKISATAQLAPC